MRARVAGIIPAAGASTRMGTDKALLDAGGKSFLTATVHALVQGGCAPVLVVVPTGREDLRAEALASGASVVENPDPGEGPITSVRRALAALGGDVDAVALLPVDHPLVRPETVASLVEAWRGGDAHLVLPMYGGARGHPAILGRKLFPRLCDPLLVGGARTVVHEELAHALLVPVGDAAVVMDLDTPEAYQKAFPGGAP